MLRYIFVLLLGCVLDIIYTIILRTYLIGLKKIGKTSTYLVNKKMIMIMFVLGRQAYPGWSRLVDGSMDSGDESVCGSRSGSVQRSRRRRSKDVAVRGGYEVSGRSSAPSRRCRPGKRMVERLDQN